MSLQDDHVPMKVTEEYSAMDWTNFAQSAFTGLVRHAITTGAGALATAGWIDGNDTQIVVGAVMALAGVAWSAFAKKAPAIESDVLKKLGLKS